MQSASVKKGNAEKEVEEVRLVEDWGIEQDAHAGKWHRQVSLLSFEKIEAFREKGAEVDFGAFGENMIIAGYDLRKIPVGATFQIGEARLVLTQIGKECHSHCEIYKKWETASCRGRACLPLWKRAALCVREMK